MRKRAISTFMISAIHLRPGFRTLASPSRCEPHCSGIASAAQAWISSVEKS